MGGSRIKTTSASSWGNEHSSFFWLDELSQVLPKLRRTELRKKVGAPNTEALGRRLRAGAWKKRHQWKRVMSQGPKDSEQQPCVEQYPSHRSQGSCYQNGGQEPCGHGSKEMTVILAIEEKCKWGIAPPLSDTTTSSLPVDQWNPGGTLWWLQEWRCPLKQQGESSIEQTWLPEFTLGEAELDITVFVTP